jgi:hypothetical protein
MLVMRMLKPALVAAAVLGTAAVAASPASARTFVSVGIGGPAYAPAPAYYPGYYGYAPGYYPGYYAPRPVYYGGGWYGRPHYYHRGYYGYHRGWRRW